MVVTVSGIVTSPFIDIPSISIPFIITKGLLILWFESHCVSQKARYPIVVIEFGIFISFKFLHN